MYSSCVGGTSFIVTLKNPSVKLKAMLLYFAGENSRGKLPNVAKTLLFVFADMKVDKFTCSKVVL